MFLVGTQKSRAMIDFFFFVCAVGDMGTAWAFCYVMFFFLLALPLHIEIYTLRIYDIHNGTYL